MTLIIHIATTLTYEQPIRQELERCCIETGDTLIGYRIYQKVQEVLFVVRLYEDYFLTQHTQTLNQALQQRAILSFQPENTNLIQIEAPSTTDISQVLQSFPLQPNESWFPAITNSEQQAYICIHQPLLSPEQTLWLQNARLDYSYI